VFADYYHGDGSGAEDQPAAEPNWLRVTVDGATLVDRWFGESTAFVLNLDPATAHSYVITVASVSETGTGPWIGTTTVCPAPANTPQSITPASVTAGLDQLPAADVLPTEQPAAPVPTVAPALPTTGSPSAGLAAAAAATTALGLLTVFTARRRTA
jgi:hypothetical protein